MYTYSSGKTHLGGSVIFFMRADSAISSILSSDVSFTKLTAFDLYSRLGHLSPNTQPLMQASAQLIVVFSILGLAHLKSSVQMSSYRARFQLLHPG